MSVCIRCRKEAVDSTACGDPCCSGCTHPDPSPIDTHPDSTKTTEKTWPWLGRKR